MKIFKTLLNTIMVAVTAGTISSCTKTIEHKVKKQPVSKDEKATGASESEPEGCPACGMG